MDFTVDEDGKYGSLVAHGLLMALVYIVATDVPGLLLVLALKTGLLPVSSIPWPGLELISVASMLLVGGVAMRLMRGTREECGLVFDRDDAFIRYAVGTGAVVAVVSYASSVIPALSTGSILSYFHSFGREQTLPMVMGYTVFSFAFVVAQAFLLFGIMQVYLSRITSAHLRLGPWDIPVAGFMVLVIILIPEFISLARLIIAGYKIHAAAALLKVFCTGVVTLAASYWFERSRSLMSPAIALGTTAGLGPLIRHVMYVWFR